MSRDWKLACRNTLRRAAYALFAAIAIGLFHIYVCRPFSGEHIIIGSIVLYGGILISLGLFMNFWPTLRDGSKALYKSKVWLSKVLGTSIVFYAAVITVLDWKELSSKTFLQLFWLGDLYHFYNPANHLGLVITLICVFAFLALGVFLGGEGVDLTPRHVRGRELITCKRAQELANQARKEGDRGILWAGIDLPSEAATTHFAVVGATGSGKTLTLRLLMQSVFPAITRGEDARALVYDAKMDIIPYLFGMGIPVANIITLNPFDARCAAWDMAADITSPVSALQLATILIPEDKRSTQPFFPNTARELLTAVIMSFIRTAPGKWDFRDVVLAASSKEQLTAVVSRIPETKDVLGHFENERTGNDIMSTLREKLHKFRFIAAAWSRAQKKISLKDWLTSNYILVLGNDEATRSALDAVNQLIFRRLSELILAQSESNTRRTWIILDEVRQAGKLEGLSALATKGRSKGACLVLGLQDIEGMQEVYGPNVAHEILGQCSNKAILRLENPSTAKWASQVFGTREILEKRRSENEGQNQGSSGGFLDHPRGHSGKSSGKSISEQIVERPLILASEFSDLPLTNKQNGLHGYYLVPGIGAYYAYYPVEFLSNTLCPEAEGISAVEWRSEEDQYLQPWTAKDLNYLGLSEKLEVAREESPSEQEQEIISQQQPLTQKSLLDGVGK